MRNVVVDGDVRIGNATTGEIVAAPSFMAAPTPLRFFAMAIPPLDRMSLLIKATCLTLRRKKAASVPN
jgi:hypothetical protein